MTRAEQIAQVRADVEEGKRRAAEHFQRTWGVPMTRENVAAVTGACIDNAHLFKPRA